MEEVMYKAAELLVGILGSLLAWAALETAKLINAKVKNELMKGVLTRLSDAVFTVVKDVQQRQVEALKAANEDGKLSDQEKMAVKRAALTALESYLGEKGLALLGKVLGLNAEAVGQFVDSKIEAAVLDLKQTTMPALAIASSAASTAGKPLQVPR